MKRTLLLVVVCLISVNAFAQTRRANRSSVAQAARSTPAIQTLPIRRVVLYSNGVAYIERRGTVTGHAEINLSFKQSQVDDVLKSMVVLDLGQGRIGAVSYNSSAPPATRMAEIPFAISAATDGNTGGGLAGVLSQLQGARVIISTGSRVVTGSLLTVEATQSQVEAGKPPVVTHRVVIASDNGAVSSFDLADVRSIQLADEGTRRDLTEFARAAAAARRRDAKTIVVTSDGAASREMIISYTVAAPIWKTTYRVVIDRSGKPFFQGWAIVDNVSEDDWNGVQLSLVSGTPVSFIQPIQNPVYRYRPIIPISEDLNLKPQTYEPGEVGGMVGTLSGVVKDPQDAVIPRVKIIITNTRTNQSFELSTNEEGRYRADNLPGGVYTLSASSPGFQKTEVTNLNITAGVRSKFDVHLQVASVSATVSVNGAVSNESISNYHIDGLSAQGLMTLSPRWARNSETLSNLIAARKSGVETDTTGDEVGDLFQYHIDQPVTVLRDRSALIPIVQTQMEGERVSIFTDQAQSHRPMSGFLLKNTSPLTLEEGSLTVIEGDAYVGEALMQRLKPQEERLISFALDLATLVNVHDEQDRTPSYLLRAVNGVVQAHYYDTRKKTYTLVNQTERPRTVYLEYPIDADDDWELSGNTPKPETRTAKYYRFRVELAAHQKLDFPITERQERMESYALSDFSREQLKLFVERKYIDDKTRAVLEQLLDLKSRIAATETRIQEMDRESAEIAQDQSRLRDNIKALTATAEAKQLITRYVSKADTQETRLEQLNKEKQVVIEERVQLHRQLETLIRGLSIDRQLAD
jgi:Carboxypeptidase regulatory-like domain